MSIICLFITNVAATKLPATFNWSTLPVAFHSSKSTGRWNQTEIDQLSRYAMVTVEKYHNIESFVPASTLAHDYFDPDGLYACQNGTDLSRCGCCVEDEIVAALSDLKEANPNITRIAYLNSNIAYPWYRAAIPFAQHPEWWLRDEQGNPMHWKKPGDGVAVSNYTWMIWDHSQPQVQELWQEACLNLTQTGVVDACFVDGCEITPQGLAPGKAEALGAGKAKMLKDLQEKVPGPLICGSDGKFLPGMAGTMAEGFGKTGRLAQREIPLLMKAAEAGVVFQAHGFKVCEHGGDPYHPEVQTELAAFLIGMGKYAYYLCSSWEDYSPSLWYSVYDMPLGEPLSKAILVDGVWHRQFKSGTNVSFDTRANSGNISWATLGDVELIV